MPSSTDSWGIEVGAHAIKAIHLQKAGGGKAGAKAVLVEHEVIPHKKVLTTPDLDMDEAIRTSLAQFVAKHVVGRASVVVSVPGNMAFARFAKLPPVEPKRVPDIVKFEAIQQIPFPIEQVEWDYQVFQQADSPEVEVGIFAITKERVMSWLSHFEAAGIPVHGVTLSPIAVYNAIAYDMEIKPDSPGMMLMDVGTLSTDLIVVSEGRLWLRTLPLGGHHFTEAIARGFKLTYSKAEKIKKEAATSKYARQIFQAMRPVFVDLVSEVQKSLGYYQSLNREVQIRGIVGMGSTFRLPGLQKFIKQQLQIEVTRLDSYKRIEPEGRVAAEFAEHAPELAPAYGLALQGLEMESVSANILPATIIRQQVWRTKGKWSIAAAACMAIAASIPILRLTLDRSAYAASRQQHSSTIQGAIQVADEKVRRLKEVETEDPRPRIENIRAIHDRTDVWPMLLLDIQRALAEANQQAGLKNGDPKEVKRIERRNRRELHVTEVFAQYLPDGKSADQQGRGGSSPMAGGMMFGGGSDGESPAATEESAANPAMIVTVRGYTPFRDPHNFVLDTFVRWLSEQAQSTERRPYRIASVSVPEFKRRGEDQGARRDVASGRSTFGAPSFGADFGSIGGSRNNFGRPANPRDPSQRERQLRGVRQLPAPNSTTLSPGGTEPGTEAPKDVWDFFPSDPLADEDTAYDMSFELTFRVELHPPEVARKSDEEFKKWLVEQEAKARGEEAAAEGEGLVAEGDEQAGEGESPEGVEATEPQESESNP